MHIARTIPAHTILHVCVSTTWILMSYVNNRANVRVSKCMISLRNSVAQKGVATAIKQVSPYHLKDHALKSFYIEST